MTMRKINGPLRGQDWLPSPEQIDAYVQQQREQRERMARRVDDGPVTILAAEGFGPTPGFDKPVPRYQRVLRRVGRSVVDIGIAAAVLALVVAFVASAVDFAAAVESMVWPR